MRKQAVTMNVILDPQGRVIPDSARRALCQAWAAAGFKTPEQRARAWAEGYRFTRLEAANKPGRN